MSTNHDPANERPPLPPFTEETALIKVRAAEDAWNTRDPKRVSLAYTLDTVLAQPRRVPPPGARKPWSSSPANGQRNRTIV